MNRAHVNRMSYLLCSIIPPGQTIRIFDRYSGVYKLQCGIYSWSRPCDFKYIVDHF